MKPRTYPRREKLVQKQKKRGGEKVKGDSQDCLPLLKHLKCALEIGVLHFEQKRTK